MKQLFLWSSLICLPTTVLASPARPHLESAPDPLDANARDFTLTLPVQAPMTLECREAVSGGEVHRRVDPPAYKHVMTIRGLKPATRYTCQAILPETLQAPPPTTFVTAELPPDLVPPTITVSTSSLARTGYVLYGMGVLSKPWRIKDRYLVIQDAEGFVRWYYKGDGGGDLDVSWIGQDRILFGGYHDWNVQPTLIGLDKEVLFREDSSDLGRYELTRACTHDAGLSKDGSSLFYLNGESNGIWTGGVIREVDPSSGELLWRWSTLEDGFEQGYLPAGSEADTDPYHPNAIDDAWEDGRRVVYLSLRDQHQILKIDYDTKQVVWKLGVGGDFTLLDDDGTYAQDWRWFFDQHDAKHVSGSLFAIHDNGVSREAYGGTPRSRALQLVVDEATMTAQLQLEYTEPGWAEPIWGGYDVQPDGTSLLAIGHCWVCSESRVSSLIELGPKAEVLWRADFTSDKQDIYRSERIDGCDIFNNLAYCPEAG